MGNINARSLGKIQKLAQDGDFDVVLHVGDFAYNFDTVRRLTERKSAFLRLKNGNFRGLKTTIFEAENL